MSPVPLRLLLVEDSEDDALLVLRELRAHGYAPDVRRVETAESLREALRSERWDLVLSDYTLPGFSAPEALSIVRDRDGDIPFIIISGAIGEETAVTALKAGAQDYVSKGNLARLVPAIERELREAAARREHRETTRALGERDQLLRALVDAAPAAILLVDAERRPRIRNRAALAVAGDGGNGARAPEWLDGVVGRALGGERIHDERVRHGPSGAARELEVSAAPVEGADGAVAGAVVIAIDVTDRVELEEQLRQSQKLEAVGRLAGGVAHDFNNILTAISGYADFLLGDLPEEGMLRADAAEIRKAAERGSSLTRQLLTLSRKQVVDPEHLDAGSVVLGLEKMLRRLVGEDLVFEVSAEPDLPVYADRGQLEQVLMNLVVNARDAMPDGGTLTLRACRAGPASVPGQRPGPAVLLEVADTGTGIPPSILDRIFEPFFTTKESGRGTGLGLSIVYGIVTQGGGGIHVDSEAGRGTRFRIYLPLEAGPAPAQRGGAPADALPAAARSATILVAEDDEASRTVAVRALREAGFRVIEAENGEAAVRRAEEADGAIDLMLLDVILPKGNGPQTAQRIRERFGVPRTLFMSGYTGDVLTQQGDFDIRGNLIAKPFGRRELVARVEEMLASAGASENDGRRDG